VNPLSVEAGRAYVARKLAEARERPPSEEHSDFYDAEEWVGPEAEGAAS
jgi:hypothetical protein